MGRDLEGCARFTGKMWETHEIYLVEQSDEIITIARRFLDVDDEKSVSAAALKIRTENGIEMKRFNALETEFRHVLIDYLMAKKKETPGTIAKKSSTFRRPTAPRPKFTCFWPRLPIR